MKKKALIIGGGPAGLTAAYELLKRSDITPIVFEQLDQVGGLSRTVNYNGNRIDIGGHRFFSKSDRVMRWWAEILPFQYNFEYQSYSDAELIKPAHTEKIMMRCNRLSRIYYDQKFYDYPISLNITTIKNLGLKRIARIAASYVNARLFPQKPEKSLEDFFINRFGNELYKTFFKDYTHKVWGIPASEIKPEWGAQRIKGISISKIIMHALKSLISNTNNRKKIETSWINKFWYPKYGPGQMWETVAEKIKEKGGTILLNHTVHEIIMKNNRVSSVIVQNSETKEFQEFEGDYLFSTMPVKELISNMTQAPQEIKNIASGLQYRDFITVGLLLKKLHIETNNKIQCNIPDNWIYIQEPYVKVGRLQVFNNWSPYLVNNPNTTWIGLEYFCTQGGELWQKSDDALSHFAIEELIKLKIARTDDVLDSCVLRVPKAYPIYFGTYNQFDKIKEFTNAINNLFLIGRNGMHKYNNQDHSMLAAMTAVDAILDETISKEDIWRVNTEKEYHEEKRT